MDNRMLRLAVVALGVVAATACTKHDNNAITGTTDYTSVALSSDPASFDLVWTRDCILFVRDRKDRHGSGARGTGRFCRFQSGGDDHAGKRTDRQRCLEHDVLLTDILGE